MLNKQFVEVTAEIKELLEMEEITQELAKAREAGLVRTVDDLDYWMARMVRLSTVSMPKEHQQEMNETRDNC